PGLNDASRGDEIDVDPGDIIPAGRERPANLPADGRLPAGDRGVLPRVRQQIVDSGRPSLELHALLDGLAHGCLPGPSRGPRLRVIEDCRTPNGPGCSSDNFRGAASAEPCLRCSPSSSMLVYAWVIGVDQDSECSPSTHADVSSLSTFSAS